MSEEGYLKHSLVVGFIPSDCESDYIMVGDPDGSETVEVVLEIRETDPLGFIVNFSDDVFSPKNDDWWDDDSKLWGEVINQCLPEISKMGKGLSPNDLRNLWAFFQEELEDDDALAKIEVFDAESNEFSKEDSHGGKFYFSYYRLDHDSDKEENGYDDDDYYGRSLIVYG